MKFIKCLMLFLSIAIVFTNCKKEKDLLDPKFETTIDFFNLKIGQKSYFTSYQSKCGDYTNALEWTKDTLLIEVAKFEDGVFTFQESFTPNSASYVGQTLPDPVEISVIFEDDYILLPDRGTSQLFWFYGNDTLFLQPTEMVELVQTDCSLILENDPFIGNDIGTVSDFKIDDIRIKDKYAVSCVPGFFEVDAYLIYQDKNLIASHVIQSGENVRGWMQL